MKIGTMRVEEAKVFNSHEGYHRFHDEHNCEFGSFEVYWQDEVCDTDRHETRGTNLCDVNVCIIAGGWYWASGFPGCLYDGDPVGPFATGLDALCDADEWHPDY